MQHLGGPPGAAPFDLDRLTAPPDGFAFDQYLLYKARQARMRLLTVPVESFIDQVKSTPSEDDLKKLFDKYKNDEAAPERAEPGFKEPRRIQVEWVSATPDTGYYQNAAKQLGPVFAALRRAEIGEISRFPSPRQLNSWAGLTPRHRESDTTVHRGAITKQGSRLVRATLIEGISRYHGGSVLDAQYRKLAKRRGRNRRRGAQSSLVYYGLRDGEIRCLAPAETAG